MTQQSDLNHEDSMNTPTQQDHGEIEADSMISDFEESTGESSLLNASGAKPRNVDSTNEEKIKIAFLGSRTTASHQRILVIGLGVALALVAVTSYLSLSRSDKVTRQVAAVGDSLTQSQRLAKSITQAVVGNPNSFAEVKESSQTLGNSLRGLREGNAELEAVGQEGMVVLESLWKPLERTEGNVKKVLEQQKVLTAVGAALRVINLQSSEFLEAAETIASLRLQQNAPAIEVLAAGQLVMLTQRIGKSANEFLTNEGVSAEAVFLLGKDLNSFNEIAQAMKNGSVELRLNAAKDPQSQKGLDELLKIYDQTKTQAGSILGNVQGLVTARQAQAEILEDSDKLRRQLEQLQSELKSTGGTGFLTIALLVLATVIALSCIVLLARVLVMASRLRQSAAEAQQEQALRVNRENQDAILRLMDELENVADGDLTRQATVSEDITGAIADSINSTVDELRVLVGSVQDAANVVAKTTADVESSSNELLEATDQQSNEIRKTGSAILDMANRISLVSTEAQGSAAVAKQSRDAAETGFKAVQNAIGGMNTIRDQIQETSKRIKRLGESSQQIGEITELISDITEQTNILALNAAIQAASAGEAGRGFSVVAEEVQRLAERSAEATRQISALVKIIQSDTQDAVFAMERSTLGVVEGAKLSDHAGTALNEIDQVSRHLAGLIEQISQSTSAEAQAAQIVAQSIQRILAVTEHTNSGTRYNAEQVRVLAEMANQLGQSVSRFKIG
jgi:twitching motility protein PilJ